MYRERHQPVSPNRLIVQTCKNVATIDFQLSLANVPAFTDELYLAWDSLLLGKQPILEQRIVKNSANTPDFTTGCFVLRC